MVWASNFLPDLIPGMSHEKKAPRTGAFFIVCSLLFAMLSGQVLATDCVTGRIDDQVEVRQIFDGDTVQLMDGRKVRLLGINTPEMGRADRPSEPLASEARKSLSALIRQAGSVGLRYGKQRKDRYKRELAHLIIDGHIDVQQVLLEQGLAIAIVVPPNLWQQDCYQQAEKRARDKGLGVWGLDYFRPFDVGRQTVDRGGFRLIKGRVIHVDKSSQSVWLDLDGGVSLRIASEDWRYFSVRDWDRWQGRNIVARGWLYRRGEQWRLRIRHPQNIMRVRSEE